MAVEDLKKNAMMAHLLDALDHKKDIGHYGRLVFTMVARHFLSEEEVVGDLAKDKDFQRGAGAQPVSAGAEPRLQPAPAREDFAVSAGAGVSDYSEPG